MKSYKNIFGTPGVGEKALYGLRFCRNDRKMERLAQNYRFYREKFLQNEGITDFSKAVECFLSQRGSELLRRGLRRGNNNLVHI